jgi:uncharacterized repeat protein (TIGR02543 family)
VVFTFEKADGQTLIWRELLHIYSNLESIFTKYFTDDDFYQTMHTVTFMDGSFELFDLRQNNVLHGAEADEPEDPINDGYEFGGWYSDPAFSTAYDFNTLVISDITLYAKWTQVFTLDDEEDFGSGATITRTFDVYNVPTWNEARTAITNGGDGSAGNNKNYVINVTGDFTVEGVTTNTFTPIYITVSLRGPGRTMTLSGNGNLIRIETNQTVILRELTLKGHSSANNSVVYVIGANSAFVMQSGKISGNTTSSSSGGGVLVTSSGTFTMHGGVISGNTASGNSGGVFLSQGATFTMHGGVISGNTADGGNGGGVYIPNNGTFTMYGGEISGNTANGSNGGGVYISGTTTFTMHGGEISGNTVDSNGGGVYISNGTTFTMQGGKISGNIATNYGGGVFVYGGTFTMEGGEISGNTADNDDGEGGGVSVYNNGTFIMEDGTISGNTAHSGGGVLVDTNGTFTMSGGKISGNTASVGGGVYSYDRVSFTMTDGEIAADNDVRVSTGVGSFDSITLSGNANVGVITLEAINVNNATITIAGEYTATTNTILNLYGSDGTITTVIGWWENKQLIKAKTGYTLKETDIAKFTMGKFICNTAANNRNIAGNATGDNYRIEDTGADMGKLVKVPVPVTGVTLSPSTLSLTVGGPAGTLTPIFTPTNATNKAVTWSISSSGIATVSNGTVTVVSAGSTTITVTTSDSNHTATCAVTVTALSDPNDLDFPAAPISGIFNVSTTAEWNAAKTAISGGGNGKNYIINVIGNFEVPNPGSTATFGSATDIKVSLRGGTGRTLTLTGSGCLIHIGSNQTVILRDLILKGHSGNDNSLVYGSSDSAFVMHSGVISGNTNTASNSLGGGVRVFGTFTMYGGEISGNTATVGGGVFLAGTFIMYGGKISGNTSASGGGVFMNNTGNFLIVNGTIYGNEAATDESLRNTASTAGAGAALHNNDGGTAQRGTFNGETWVPAVGGGTLATTSNTINVLNGGIVP